MRLRTLRTLHRSALTLLVLFPAVMTAQRGGGMGRGGGGRGGGRGGGATTYDELSSKDIGKFDPVKLLLDKHKDLKLDDQETKTLTQLDSGVKLDNKRLADRIDSAQKALADNANNRSARGGGGRRSGGSGGTSGGSGTSDSTSVRSRGRAIPERQVIADALTLLRREKDSVGLQALTVLSESQRPKANELLKKRDDELTKILKGAGFTWPAAAPVAMPAPASPLPKDTVTAGVGG